MIRFTCLLICGLSFSLAANPTWADDFVPPVPTTQVAQAPAPEPVSAIVPVETPAAATGNVSVPVANTPDLTGCWAGTWQSCTNGHHGPMSASFCRLCDGNYQVTFVGKFCKVIPFRYTTTLNVTCQKDGVTYMSGSHFLGPLMGTFSYNAWANDRQFVSSYSSKHDQGTFTMCR